MPGHTPIVRNRLPGDHAVGLMRGPPQALSLELVVVEHDEACRLCHASSSTGREAADWQLDPARRKEGA
jgi:hypothetical protein